MCYMSGNLLHECGSIMPPLYRLARLDGLLELGAMGPEVGVSHHAVLLPIFSDRELLAVADDLPALGRLAAAGAAPRGGFDSGQAHLSGNRLKYRSEGPLVLALSGDVDPHGVAVAGAQRAVRRQT